MIAIEAFNANLGKTILYSLIVGIPTAIIAGPVFGKFIGKRIHTEPPAELAQQFSAKKNSNLPGFGITLFTILLPVILMLIGSIANIVDPDATSGFTVLASLSATRLLRS